MLRWILLALALLFVLVLAAALALCIFRLWCWMNRRRAGQIAVADGAGADHNRTLRDGMVKLQQASVHRSGNEDAALRPWFYDFRGSRDGGMRPVTPLFSWSSHPSLVTEAVENGWPGFAFTTHAQAQPPPLSGLLGLCGAVDADGGGAEPEISWEVCQGSADFLQKIRLNQGFKRVNSASPTSSHHRRRHHHPFSALSVIKTSLPLPGPPLGNSSFPQEAYFEITILGSLDHVQSIGRGDEGGERIKLMHESSNLRSNSDSLAHINKLEELKLNVRDGKTDAVAASIGLTVGGAFPMKLPGSYPGSIGFNSTGSLYLDGIKLAFESEKAEWGTSWNKVIGCGFDPSQKKVFFTVGSELIHMVHCKQEEFGSPLYPILAANSDITVLVNFGQCPFEFAPANAQRTSNPCFIGPVVSSATALGYEDSRELFSMGRINSQWLNRFMSRGSHNHNNNHRGVEFDEESEADLFEIVLDRSSTRSMNSTVHQ
ncbi:hypothetical protein SAY87_010343 [Trapa incisa]|uniref:SPRY domain-containing protein n=1 Tax=Trapa incisa TaxID=236973 RepID=A0AAN7GHL8_9MYRT|nr:hypothetical protein SAY87_010343 [Trapa incisa]